MECLCERVARALLLALRPEVSEDLVAAHPALASCAEPSSPTHKTLAPSSPVFATSSKITTTNLGTLPNGGSSVAYGIDAVGATIVGYAYPSTGSGVPQHATRWVFASSRWTI